MRPTRMTAVFTALLAWCVSATAADIFVAPGGRPHALGTEADPADSLAHAVELSRRSPGPDTLWLRGGRYRQDAPVVLDDQDAGCEGSPLTIRGVQGEQVIITGGHDIPAALFKPVEQAGRLARLHPRGRGQVWVADLGGTDMKSLFGERPRPTISTDGHNSISLSPPTLLSWNGFILQPAQFPNRGYAHMGEIPEKGPASRWLKPGEPPAPFSYEKPGGGTLRLVESIDLPALRDELERTHDIRFEGYFSNDWLYEKNSLGGVDPEAGTLTLLHFSRYGLFRKPGMMPRRVRIVNALCQLDEPGEWYFDRPDNLLYLWPVKPFTDEQPVTVVGGPPFIQGSHVDHVVVRDITFENFGDAAVEFDRSNHILVAGCTFRSGNGLAVSITHGMHNGLTSCDIHDTETDFKMSGLLSNRRTLTPEHNFATNNHVHHCRLRGYGMGGPSGVGFRYANNLLHDLNGGIFFGENDALVEYNEFYRMGYEMGDWNVGYCGINLRTFNNVIRYNFLHHIIETGGYPVSGFRPDGGVGMHCERNIFYKCGRGAADLIRADNHIDYNVVMETPFVMHTGKRPYQGETKEEYIQAQWDDELERRARIARGELPFSDKYNVIQQLEVMVGEPEPWTTDNVWTRRYPVISNVLPHDGFDSNIWVQCFCSLKGNYYDNPGHGDRTRVALHGSEWNHVSSWDEIVAFLPDSSTWEHPLEFEPSEMFEDPESMDFRFRDAFTPIPGFEKWDFSRVGLVLDEYRRSMPDKQTYRSAIRKKYDGLRSTQRYDMERTNKRFPAPQYLADTTDSTATDTNLQTAPGPLPDGLF